jgi:hypothetical protein
MLLSEQVIIVFEIFTGKTCQCFTTKSTVVSFILSFQYTFSHTHTHILSLIYNTYDSFLNVECSNKYYEEMIFIQELYSGGNDWQIILWTPLFDEYDEKQQHVCVFLFSFSFIFWRIVMLKCFLWCDYDSLGRRRDFMEQYNNKWWSIHSCHSQISCSLSLSKL